MMKAAHLRNSDDLISFARQFCRPGNWTVLSERVMSAAAIVVFRICFKDAPQMAFANNDHMIQAFSPDRPNYTFDIDVLPWRLLGNDVLTNAHLS